MKNKKMNLRLFEDGGGAGSGSQGSSAGAGDGSQNGNAGSTSGAQQTGKYTYEQLEEIASSRAEKAGRSALADFFRKQGMTEAEITSAIRDFKEKKRASEPDIGKLERERDEAQNELKTYKQKELLKENGVESRYVDFVLFEVNKKVTDKVDFETALKAYIKENPQYSGGGYRVSQQRKSGTQSTAGNTGNETNDYVNSMIRKAARR